MKQRKTKEEKIKSQERVAKNQLEYAKFLKQKTDLREYKEALLIQQENVRRNFVMLELGIAFSLSSIFQTTKSLNEHQVETKYQQKEVTFDFDGWKEESLGYIKYIDKDKKLKNPTFLYQSEWNVPENSGVAYRINIEIKNKRKLYAYLESLQEQNKIELPNEDIATWSLETGKIDEINLSDPSTFSASYQYVDTGKKIEIPVSQEEKEKLEREVKWLLVFLGIMVTPVAYELSTVSYKSDIKELKKRIRTLEENQE